MNRTPCLPRLAIAAVCGACLLIAGAPSFASPPAPLHGVERGEAAPTPRRTYLPVIRKAFREPLFIVLGAQNLGRGIALKWGGDKDTEIVQVGIPPVEARRTGNGLPLPAADGNDVADSYMQFEVDDVYIYAGAPTTRVSVAVEYWDQGTDGFILQYDAVSGGASGDGRFKDSARVHKTDTRRWVVATFTLCDAFFGNRDQDADLRLADDNDGAEIIRSVTIQLLPRGPSTLNVDAFGANPRDALPDSNAIQTCLDRACDGDTVTFTSGVGSAGYQGYRIDKTVFLVANGAKSGLTFTSTDPAKHALLRAEAGLKGFVVRLFARSRISNPGDIDRITVSHLDLDGGLGVRRCFGADGLEDGVGDNWGSWLPECGDPGDAWCRAGTLAMDGGFVGHDAAQDYLGYPSEWSTGLLVDDVKSLNAECGSALALSGAASTIRNSTIDVAGDHVHATGCTATEADEGVGDWSDGITFTGPAHLITGNTILDPSDVGIVFFGGKGTVIENNTVRARTGNRGAFAGIAVHPWWYGDVSGVRVTGNQVISEGSLTCGGLHTGIDIGTHMWGAGCVGQALPCAVGNPLECRPEPPSPLGEACTADQLCQEWAYVPAGQTLILADNYVSGCHINYLIEGLDLVGTLVESGNSSGPPRLSDWQSANGCAQGSETDRWGALNRVAHHPSRPGWVDVRVHCER